MKKKTPVITDKDGNELPIETVPGNLISDIAKAYVLETELDERRKPMGNAIALKITLKPDVRAEYDALKAELSAAAKRGVTQAEFDELKARVDAFSAGLTKDGFDSVLEHITPTQKATTEAARDALDEAMDAFTASVEKVEAECNRINDSLSSYKANLINPPKKTAKEVLDGILARFKKGDGQ